MLYASLTDSGGMKRGIALPSPYPRKARIALLEKRIAFETVVENPWLPDTAVPGANPLGNVPALILDDGTVVHDSKVIVEYLETLDDYIDFRYPAFDWRPGAANLERLHARLGARPAFAQTKPAPQVLPQLQ